MIDFDDLDPETTDLRTFVAMVIHDLQHKMIDDGEALEAITERIERDQGPR